MFTVSFPSEKDKLRHHKKSKEQRETCSSKSAKGGRLGGFEKMKGNTQSSSENGPFDETTHPKWAERRGDHRATALARLNWHNSLSIWASPILCKVSTADNSKTSLRPVESANQLCQVKVLAKTKTDCWCDEKSCIDAKLYSATNYDTWVRRWCAQVGAATFELNLHNIIECHEPNVNWMSVLEERQYRRTSCTDSCFWLDNHTLDTFRQTQWTNQWAAL